MSKSGGKVTVKQTRPRRRCLVLWVMGCNMRNCLQCGARAVSRVLCKHPHGLMFRAGYTGCTRAEGKALRRRNLSADSAAGIRRDRAQLDRASS
jgi:hypothetical protein